jgi:hypothetical protein
MKLRICLLALVLLALPACESFPVSGSYSTTIAGHKIAAAYDKKDGLVVAAEKLPDNPSK